MRVNVLAALAMALAGFAAPSFAHTEIYTATLSGPAEAPPNASPGTGTARVTIDLDLLTMRLEASFSGVLGNVTASHIHCCTALPSAGTIGVATPIPTFPGFPSGVTAGTYDRTFDLTAASSYNPAFVTNNGGTLSTAMNTLLAGISAGKSYLNIHTNQFPGGEIRGFLQPVPEAETYALMLTGLVTVGALARTRRGQCCGSFERGAREQSLAQSAPANQFATPRAGQRTS